MQTLRMSPSEVDPVALSRSYGVSSQATTTLSTSRLQRLDGLPEEVRNAYRNLSPSQKQVLQQRLQGSSRILFVRINHREAFIKGRVAGIDVFDLIVKKIDDLGQAGNFDPAMKKPILSAVEALRRLTPSQRDAMVGLLEADLAHPPLLT